MALVLRISRRLLAFAAYGAAIAALVFIVWPLLPVPSRNGSSEVPAANAAEVKAPARPSGLPHRIPSWAWDLHSWLLTAPADRGARPKAAPRHVPAWFWTWRSWRLALAPAS
jgi:hypothetical protein